MQCKLMLMLNRSSYNLFVFGQIRGSAIPVNQSLCKYTWKLVEAYEQIISGIIKNRDLATYIDPARQ